MILGHLRALEDRRRLNFIWDIRAAIGSGENVAIHIIQLANVAYADDPNTLCKIVSAVASSK